MLKGERNLSWIKLWVGLLGHRVNTNKIHVKVKVAQSCPILCNSMVCSPWNFPGQNTGVGSFSLLQGIFPTQGLNPTLPHCRQVLLPAEPEGKPKNAGVGSLFLLQRIFLTQESKLGSPAWQADSLPTELSGKPITILCILKH